MRGIAHPFRSMTHRLFRARAVWRRVALSACLVVLSACDSMGPPTYPTAPGRELLNRIDLYERARHMGAVFSRVSNHPAFSERVGARMLLQPSWMPGQVPAHMLDQVPLLAAAGLPRVSDAHVRAWWRVRAVQWRYLPAEHCIALESGQSLPDSDEQLQLTELQFSDDVHAAYVAALGAAAWAELSRTPMIEPPAASEEEAAFRTVFARLEDRLEPEERAVMAQWIRQGHGADAETWCQHGRRFHDIVERMPDAQQAIVMRLHLGRYLAWRTPYAVPPQRTPSPAPPVTTPPDGLT